MDIGKISKNKSKLIITTYIIVMTISLIIISINNIIEKNRPLSIIEEFKLEIDDKEINLIEISSKSGLLFDYNKLVRGTEHQRYYIKDESQKGDITGYVKNANYEYCKFGELKFDSLFIGVPFGNANTVKINNVKLTSHIDTNKLEKKLSKPTTIYKNDYNTYYIYELEEFKIEFSFWFDELNNIYIYDIQ